MPVWDGRERRVKADPHVPQWEERRGRSVAPAMADGLLVMEPRVVYDKCIVGVARRFNTEFLVYDEAMVLAAIEAEADPDDADPELTAREHYEFNVVGGWVGEATPAFVRPWSEDE